MLYRPDGIVVAGQNSYDMILDAAEVVVAEDGAPRLTLDAVARRAGLSKGGLLYNFATKDALLEAMIARLCRRFEEACGLAEAHMGEGPATKLKAYLSVTMLKGPGQDRAASALLAAVANNLELLKPIRDHYRSWLQQLSGRPTFARDVSVWLAAEGLWLLELLRVSPLDAKQRRAVANYLGAQAAENSSRGKYGRRQQNRKSAAR